MFLINFRVLQIKVKRVEEFEAWESVKKQEKCFIRTDKGIQYGSISIALTQECTHFLYVGFVVAGGGLNSHNKL